MDRIQIESIGKNITSKYLFMIEEMSQQAVADRIISENATGIFYFKIKQISKRWLTEETPIWKQMTDLFIGLNSVAVPISIVFVSDAKELGVYVGTVAEYVDLLEGMLRSAFPQIVFKAEKNSCDLFEYSNLFGSSNFYNGGFLKGNPTGRENINNLYQLDSVIKGMYGKRWAISIFATPVKKAETLYRHQEWLTHASACSELSQVTFSDTDNLETTTYHKSYNHSEQYSKKVEAFCQKTAESIALGEWCVTVNFSSDSSINAKLLGGLLTSAFFGEESEPEPVHALYNMSGMNPTLINGMSYTHTSYGDIPHPKYSTFLSSKELAIYSAFPTIDTAGFSISDYVEFDVCQGKSGDLEIGQILDSGIVTDNSYSIDSNEFNRHCLIVGLTGSGKTNTVKSLICGMTKGKKRPIMVIEPAKKEYWELYKLGFEDLQVYSVGSNENNAHTFCINPFERSCYIDEGGNRHAVPIQTHIDFVYAAFKASFIMYTPMPYVLERAIYEIYEDCGWDIHNNVNKNGFEVYPTIEDLYFKIPDVVTAMGYDAKMRNDLIGSLQARINSMRLGTKGDTLNVSRSFPFDKIFNGNVVIELEDIGDDDVKAFIISLILVNLLEYRRQQPDCQLEVRHLMLIEEAHRLLKNVQSSSGENADPRGAAVEFFCNLLAELRSKGQGFIVADQIPSKLAPDLIKNTNLKIVHRTVAAEERELVGGAMHMTEAQIDSLSSLKQGVAAVYSEGDNRPKLVKSRYAGAFMTSGYNSLSREDVLRLVEGNCITINGKTEYCSLTNTKNALCRSCNSHCQKEYTDILARLKDYDYFLKFLEWNDPSKTKSCVAKKLDEQIKIFLQGQLTDQGCDADVYCLLNCMLDKWEIDDKLKEKIVDAFGML